MSGFELHFSVWVSGVGLEVLPSVIPSFVAFVGLVNGFPKSPNGLAGPHDKKMLTRVIDLRENKGEL